MKSTLTLTFCLIISVLTNVHAQSDKPKTYFDKMGRKCEVNMAYYYRLENDSAGVFTSHFMSNDKIYFKGKIIEVSATDESLNRYAGKCMWFHRNGNPSHVRNYSDKGIENGITLYYYESGKLWKEMTFENGKLSGSSFIEYNEDGTKSRLLEDHFDNNFNDWDLYTGDKSTATITNGKLEIVSLTKDGSSRYLNWPIESGEYTIETLVDLSHLKDNDKVGLIYGFKNWQNYHYFAISKKGIYIGSFYEGVKAESIAGMYCSSFDAGKLNNLKIISNGEKEFFSVNGEIQYKEKSKRLYGNNFGLVVSGNAKLIADKFVLKELNTRESGAPTSSNDEKNIKSTGSGIIFSTSGYILTNYHVIENAKDFLVELNENSSKKTYKAELVIQDKENDLAVIKIKDPNFTDFPKIPYSFKESGQIDIGSSVFTIGYPHALTGMGKEAKFTDGKISAKTGFNGSMNSFQTTIPVQPGNSGGPVFNENGQLIGVINATFKQADNVSYVIKLNYIKNLIELMSETVPLPSSSDLDTLTLEEKLKILPTFVALIKVK